MTLGPIAFLSPALLAGLLALPLIWWLLRAVPPRPQRIDFPPTRILVGIENRDRTPAKTPWWLTLIRMAAAGLVILALAEPVLNPNRETALAGSGPVVLVVDNGWPAAAHWSNRTFMLERLIAEAEGQSRPVMIVPTANPTKSVGLRVEAPTAARSTAAAIQPQPFAPDRPAIAEAIASALAGASGVSIVWLTDGIDHDDSAGAFVDRLKGLASAGLAVVETSPAQEALGASADVVGGGRLEAQVLRAEPGAARSGTLHALSGRGQRLGSAPFTLGAGDTRAVASFDLPLELRNQVTRVEIDGERSAGAVHLLDARSQWHRVGIYASESLEEAQPLLAPLYYIERALAPFTEIAKSEDANLPAAIDSILKRNVSVLVLADVGVLPPNVHDRVADWVKKGGVLVRFAGPRLEKGGDDLLPVALRLGGRTLGGALSWSSPQALAPFGDDGPFAGLSVPPDVLVNRQVLADPAGLTPDVKVWARLKDGTPLVTAARRGDGQVVFFHVTANSDWSNLPLSGLFVDMLRRLSSLGHLGSAPQGGSAEAAHDTEGAAAGATPEVLSPLQVLDGFGLLKSPLPTTQGIAAAKITDARPNAENPPGYYGPAGSPRALNLITSKTVLKPLPPLPSGVERRQYQGDTAQPLKPQLLTAAMALLFADILAVLLLQAGGLGILRRARRAAAVLAIAALGAGALICLSTAPASAQAAASSHNDAMAVRATSKVTFGYVVTGDPTTDDTSRRGLLGLDKELTRRTAVEPGEPFAVNIDSDEITFFPVLYWPVLPNARPLSQAVLAKIDAYMKQGGMIIFDTKDYGQGIPTGYNLRDDGSTPLQRMLGNLDIPRLEPVPENHVLTKSFYLLRAGFPGRYEGGSMWVEAEETPRDGDHGRRARRVDGVSSILITSNDLASAWAIDDGGRPIYPVVPGGERQREMAYRVGINIIMYALTGNYKADQVHVPALLERLGQ
jgi:hypothetical protein